MVSSKGTSQTNPTEELKIKIRQMDFQDHDYANKTCDKLTPMQFTYKSKYEQEGQC